MGADPSETERANRSHIHVKATNADVEDSDNGTKVTVPVSGLSEDRDGDKFTESGVDSLVKQINSESIPMYPNHGLSTETGGFEYRFQDMMGRWEAAERDGDVVNATATLRENNEAAEELKDLLSQDMPVGFSVGFGWDESDASERDTGGMEFDDADLMEVSAVGIPSNPSAVVQAGTAVASAMKDSGLDVGDDLENVEISIDMTDEDTPEETDGEPSETEGEDAPEETEADELDELSDETLTAIQSSVQSNIEAHMDALVADIMESLADGEYETEESDEDEEEEEEEETEGGDMDDEDEDEEDEKVAELEKTVDKLEAELETLKTDSADASERKGGMVPNEEDDPEEKDVETEEAFAETLV